VANPTKHLLVCRSYRRRTHGPATQINDLAPLRWCRYSAIVHRIELIEQIAHYVTGDDPGHAVGVYRGGELVAEAAAGQAVLEHDIPIGADTLFDIASASKQFTAACLLLLQRDGLLSLEDDVRAHLPELALPAPVSLRHCLSHTGGVRECYSLCDLTGVPVAGMDETRLMRLLAGQASLNFPPGTGWSYSNSGFVLAAAVLRRLTGRSLAEFAADRLLGPLGMRVTRFRDDLGVPVPRLATGYTPAADGCWRRVDITEETVGDGGIVTSVSDLAAWHKFMLTGAVHGADIRDALLEPATLADGRRLPYALGLEITTVGGRRVYLHSGQIGGFRSALAYLMDDELGIAVLANRDDTFPAEIAVRTAGRLTGADVPTPPARLALQSARAAQPAAAGLWYCRERDTFARLSAADDGTLAQVEGDWSGRYTAMSDGSWLGTGVATSSRLRLVGEELWRDETVGDEPPEIYARAGEPPAPSPPSGTYYSAELHAYATLAAAESPAPGAAAITIGLADPRVLAPASDGVWAGDGLTVRLLDGATIVEVSLYGAQRCRFDLVDGPPPPRQRGL
jgi:CubicO group peptidase (beta-lactamase class C family)